MDHNAEKEKQDISLPNEEDDGHPEIAELINTSGHVQQLDRNFGFWSICAVSVVADNAWGASAGSLVTAFYDGGAPGVLYEFITATFFYCFIAASLAELASAIPSSASVYHWASVTGGPKYGRVCSWFAGWWNYFAWNFGSASAALYGANAVLAIYSLYHDDYVPSRWQVFIVYVILTWLSCGIVLFGHRVLPHIMNVCAAMCLGIWFVSLMVCAIMPSTTGKGYASHSFIWKDFKNLTGYSSNGFVFLLGVLNGAFGIGTPEGCTHLAEEIPDPKRNIPKGVAAQLTTGFFTTFTFYIAILYAINSLDDVLNSAVPELPLAAIYLQATNSKSGATGLLVLFIIDEFVTIPGAFIACGRMLWTLARDDATPFSPYVASISPRFRNQFVATVICGCVNTLLGCIYIGSAQAFNSFVGVFTIFTTMSYLATILPHLLSRRKYLIPGPFWMPAPWAYIVGGIACTYIILFNVTFMFPYALPTNAQTMNYSCVMSGGLTIIVGVWYLWKRSHGYVGPKVALQANDEILHGEIALETARRASASVGA